MIFIADITVEVVLFPDLAAPAKYFVNLLGCKRFPRMNDGLKWKAGSRFDQRMHVIGHDDPRQQAVAYAVKVK